MEIIKLTDLHFTEPFKAVIVEDAAIFLSRSLKSHDRSSQVYLKKKKW